MSNLLNLVWNAFRTLLMDCCIVDHKIFKKSVRTRLISHVRLLSILSITLAVSLKTQLLLVPCSAYCLSSFFAHAGNFMGKATGDWNHWMTTGLYKFGNGVKAIVVSNNKTASFLNDLGRLGKNNFGWKALQIIIGIVFFLLTIEIVILIIKSIIGILWIAINKYLPNHCKWFWNEVNSYLCTRRNKGIYKEVRYDFLRKYHCDSMSLADMKKDYRYKVLRMDDRVRSLVSKKKAAM